MTRDFFRNSGDEIRIIGRFFSVLLLDKKQINNNSMLK